MEKTKKKTGKEKKGVERKQKREQGWEEKWKESMSLVETFLKNKFAVLGCFAKFYNLPLLGSFMKGQNLFGGFSLVIFCFF